jgi:hypothetical protein
MSLILRSILWGIATMTAIGSWMVGIILIGMGIYDALPLLGLLLLGVGSVVVLYVLARAVQP